MIDWRRVDTIMLDMDGTLLDLHFDNYFWQEFVPQQFAAANSISVEQAKKTLYPKFKSVEGTMDWYCLDYWTDQLGLDIVALKAEIKHLIKILPNVENFLSSVKHCKKHVLLVTNAHLGSLQLKMQHTGIENYFDDIVSSHQYGSPKEEQKFWSSLREQYHFEPAKTLLIDDSLPVLRSARKYGIEHLLAIHKPDSQRIVKDSEEFEAVKNFNDLLPI